MEIRIPLKSGKKDLIARHNSTAQAIEIVYDPAGSVLPNSLKGDFTTFEKAEQAIRSYLAQFDKKVK